MDISLLNGMFSLEGGVILPCCRGSVENDSLEVEDYEVSGSWKRRSDGKRLRRAGYTDYC